MSSEAAPAAVERYGEEIRESYLERDDKLSFRVDDGNVEHRFFENGREDAVKQVIQNKAEHSRVVKYAMRDDGCTEYTRALVQGGAGQFSASFDGRSDGVKSIVFVLRGNCDLDVGADNAARLYREKLLHIAVKLDADVAQHKFLEAYQDNNDRSLRVVVPVGDLGGHKETVLFRNDQPHEDERYEAAKFLVMNAVRAVVDLERQLYITLYPFISGASNADMVVVQRDRMRQLATSLFSAFDEVTNAEFGVSK